jgi:AraC-like DNA-binding protein
MSKTEKVIVLDLIRIMNINYRSNKPNIALDMSYLIKLTGKSRRTVLRALERLSKASSFFEITMEDNTVFFPTDFRAFKLNERRSILEADVQTKHILMYILKRTKNRTQLPIESQKKVFADICTLIRQYRIKGFATIAGLIQETIKGCGYLSPSYLHSLIKSKLAENQKAEIKTEGEGKEKKQGTKKEMRREARKETRKKVKARASELTERAEVAASELIERARAAARAEYLAEYREHRRMRRAEEERVEKERQERVEKER